MFTMSRPFDRQSRIEHEKTSRSTLVNGTNNGSESFSKHQVHLNIPNRV